MVLNSVCAVVVTFHPDDEVFKNLSALCQQVENVVVVDNGSSLESLELLRASAARTGFELIENGENLGIATALNLGIRHAQSIHADSVLLFDQDSTVTEGFTETMLRGFNSNRWGIRLGILAPYYVDKRLGSPIPGDIIKDGCLEAAITSGSLVPISVIERYGGFEDVLFIDAVDYEYSLRLRSQGLYIDQCAEAVLLHSPGTPWRHNFRGRYLFQTSNYSPARRYYQERNKVWVVRRYASRFPFFCSKLFFLSAKDYLKILLAEDQKWEKFRACSLGILDGLVNRMGRKEWP